MFIFGTTSGDEVARQQQSVLFAASHSTQEIKRGETFFACSATYSSPAASLASSDRSRSIISQYFWPCEVIHQSLRDDRLRSSRARRTVRRARAVRLTMLVSVGIQDRPHEPLQEEVRSRSGRGTSTRSTMAPTSGCYLHRVGCFCSRFTFGRHSGRGGRCFKLPTCLTTSRGLSETSAITLRCSPTRRGSAPSSPWVSKAPWEPCSSFLGCASDSEAARTGFCCSILMAIVRRSKAARERRLLFRRDPDHRYRVLGQGGGRER